MKNTPFTPNLLASGFSRRKFVKMKAGLTAGLATARLGFAASPDISRIPIGLCNHSLRSFR